MPETPYRRPPRRRAPRRRATARPLRRLLAAIAAIAVAVVVVVLVLGGGESASDTVARAFGKGPAITTAQLDIQLQVSAGVAGADQPLNVAVSGPYAADQKGHTSFDLQVDLGDAQGQGAGALGLLGVGGKTYVTIGGQAFTVSSQGVDDLKAKDAKDDGKGLSLDALGIDPRSWLKDPETVGEEQLDGQDVTHVRAGVDTARLATDLQTLLGRAEKATDTAKQTKAAADAIKQMQRGITSARIDVWAGKGEGALRRMKLDVTVAKGTVSVDFGLSRINAPVKIAKPKKAQPLKDLLDALEQAGALGGAAAGSTGDAGGGEADGGGTDGGSDATGDASSTDGGAATGTDATDGSDATDTGGDTDPGAGSAAGASAYNACVAAAGDDVTKLQACKDLAP